MMTQRHHTAVTTVILELTPENVVHHARLTIRETNFAGIDGGRRLQYYLKPPLRHGQNQQTQIPDRHRFRPLRSPS
jgi:hypothetical protein